MMNQAMVPRVNMLIDLLLIFALGTRVLGYWYLPDFDGEGEEEKVESLFKAEYTDLDPVSMAAGGIQRSLDLAISEYLEHKGEFTPEIINDWPTTNVQTLHRNSPRYKDTGMDNEAHADFFTLRTESEGSSERSPFISRNFDPRRSWPLLESGEAFVTAAKPVDQSSGEKQCSEIPETFAIEEPERPHIGSVDLCEKFNMRLMDMHSRDYIPARPYWRNGGQLCEEDDFKVIKKIGKGAQGEVYLAFHQPSGTRVALKYLTSATDRLRFPFIRMEECLQDRLNGHPYIAEHYCTFISRTKKSGLAVLALQLIEDPVDMWDFVYLKKWDSAVGDWDHHFKYGGDTVARLAAQMISAMWYMHQMQVIYRDFKVENILVRPCGDISLLDLGVSSDPAKPCHLSHNRLLGTPYYFAPEYMRPGRPRFVAKEADWYALGISLYELAFRDGPFPQTTGMSYKELTGYIANGFKCQSDDSGWASLCDLVNRLCDPDPRLRLGNTPGSRETFLHHPFLAHTDIATLLRDSDILVQIKRSMATVDIVQ